MTPLQICLIIVGVILLVASFFVTEKLTNKEVDELSRLSSAQLQRVVDKELETVEEKVADVVDEAIDKAVEDSRRPMEELSNEKIMAINEYSDSVMDSINKTHNEIVFLYNMLNDKQDEIKQIVASIDRSKAQLRELSGQVDSQTAKVAAAPVVAAPIVNDEPKKAEEKPEEEPKGFVFKDDEKTPEVEESFDPKAELHSQIKELYDEGLTVVEIGRRLKCGVGEVKLVIDLANHGGNSET